MENEVGEAQFDGLRAKCLFNRRRAMRECHKTDFRPEVLEPVQSGEKGERSLPFAGRGGRS